MATHIAVVDPASRVPELDAFNRLQCQHEVTLSYHLPCLVGMESLQQLPLPIDAVIILGSGASVYDQLPWQNKLTQWLHTHLEQGTPTLGLCYGHQLLAHMLGGRVDFYQSTKEKLVGIRDIHFNPTKRFWQGIDKGRFIISHREHVVELPPECEIMAYSSTIAIDGFAHRTKPIFGMQSHPEAGPGFIENQSLPLTNDDSHFISGQLFLSKFINWIRQ